ncbi:hypothetical protein C9374_012672 [Naegleria lovaniensis]|uniref:GATA-type domain-containing protein n=1 Tax=Naegleria lovaniensis TaxID=51637 RepID=A0AA88GWV0_NAELO|nr:uncharacterized protein C9374_012672 [Naegleria lovaniensis]KAG2392420.1 hypothetical protein C9374_012672 [Naegleria lovaniensis]
MSSPQHSTPQAVSNSNLSTRTSSMIPAWIRGNRYGIQPNTSTTHARIRKKKCASLHTSGDNEEESHCNHRSNTNRKSKPTIPLTCENCKTVETPVWRKGSNGEPLCNKCGLYVLRHGKSRPLEFDSIREIRKRRQEDEVNHTCNGENTKRKNEGCDNVETSQKKTKYDKNPNVQTSSSKALSHSSSPMSNYGNNDCFESQSMLRLKQQLEEAVQKYPEVVCTLISLVRKHVLPQHIARQSFLLSQQPHETSNECDQSLLHVFEEPQQHPPAILSSVKSDTKSDREIIRNFSPCSYESSSSCRSGSRYEEEKEAETDSDSWYFFSSEAELSENSDNESNV